MPLPKHSIYKLFTYEQIIQIRHRVLCRCEPIPHVGCTVYSGGRSTDGKDYSKISLFGIDMFVHRVTWELENGPIPDGLVLDHECRWHPCVDPAHLHPVTSKVNTYIGEAVFFQRRVAA